VRAWRTLSTDAGEYVVALSVLDRGIGADPVCEDLSRRAMVLEASLGRQAAALARYRKLEATLDPPWSPLDLLLEKLPFKLEGSRTTFKLGNTLQVLGSDGPPRQGSRGPAPARFRGSWSYRDRSRSAGLVMQMAKNGQEGPLTRPSLRGMMHLR
jgi:hypothetical protein